MKDNNKKPSKLILDREGLAKFEQEIKDVEQQLADIRMYKGTDAIYQGDNWHDNPTLYQTELQEMSLIAQLKALRQKLETVEIVERDPNSDVVQLGDVLKINMIFDKDDQDAMTIKLVGRAGDAKGEIPEISIESPLGNSVYKKRVSERVSYSVNGQEVLVDILEKIDLTKEAPTTEMTLKKTKK